MLQETNAIRDMANQRARHVYLFHETPVGTAANIRNFIHGILETGLKRYIKVESK